MISRFAFTIRDLGVSTVVGRGRARRDPRGRAVTSTSALRQRRLQHRGRSSPVTWRSRSLSWTSTLLHARRVAEKAHRIECARRTGSRITRGALARRCSTVSVTTRRPSRMIATRSATRWTSASEWDESSTVRPPRPRSAHERARTRLCISGIESRSRLVEDQQLGGAARRRAASRPSAGCPSTAPRRGDPSRRRTERRGRRSPPRCAHREHDVNHARCCAPVIRSKSFRSPGEISDPAADRHAVAARVETEELGRPRRSGVGSRAASGSSSTSRRRWAPRSRTPRLVRRARSSVLDAPSRCRSASSGLWVSIACEPSAMERTPT